MQAYQRACNQHVSALRMWGQPRVRFATGLDPAVNLDYNSGHRQYVPHRHDAYLHPHDRPKLIYSNRGHIFRWLWLRSDRSSAEDR